MSALQPHQQRVVDESQELEESLERLLAFVESPAFEGLDVAEQSRLTRQMFLMGQLLGVLNERVAELLVASAQKPDFLAGVKACDLSGEGTCEACQ